jgi:hypothetical protein
MLSLEEKDTKDKSFNKNWFSQTTMCIHMNSSLYFTATRNIMTSDIIHVFENILNLGIVYEECVNIVPILDKNYNHVFLKIKWNNAVETANFVNQLVVNSSIKVHHNKGYWVCRMNHNPLKMRHSKRCVNSASFYCDNSESEEEENLSMHIKEIIEAIEKVSTNGEEGEISTNGEEGEVSTNGEEEDFYVIKEEIKEEINSVIE